MVYFKKKDMFQILGLYIFICFCVYFIQDSLLYFPDKNSSFNSKLWTAIKLDNTVLGLETNNINEDKIIVLFHGNAGNASVRDYYLNIIPEKYHLIVAEYPGFGTNSQTPISKNNIVNNARQLMTFIKAKKSKEIIIMGESLGTGIATQMANEFHIKKLILITPYSKISDVAQNKFWFLPVFLILKDDYDNISNLKNYEGNILFLICEKDEVINPKFALKLFDSYSGLKEKIIVLNAGYNNWMRFINQEQIKEFTDFIDK